MAMSKVTTADSSDGIQNSQRRKSSTAKKGPGIVVVEENGVDEDDEGRDYRLFLEKARLEEKKKQDAVLKAIEEADRRRRTMNMDPWARKMNKF